MPNLAHFDYVQKLTAGRFMYLLHVVNQTESEIFNYYKIKTLL